MSAAIPWSKPERRGTALQLLEPSELRELDREIAQLLAPGSQLEPSLAGAVRDTLENPGSLWRAQLAWAVGRALGLDAEATRALAAGVESFHTASLLLDDLPAMDDGVIRRGRPCVHRVHGDAAALLAALAFVHRGYARIWRALHEAPLASRTAAEILVEECLGLEGILDGQARDLATSSGPSRLDQAARTAADKTVPLLRLALVLPAVVASAPEAVRRDLDELAGAWGLAYQILDDLRDLSAGRESGEEVSDRQAGRANFAAAAGRAAAHSRLDRELARAARCTERLGAGRSRLARVLARLERVFADQRRELAPPVTAVPG